MTNGNAAATWPQASHAGSARSKRRRSMITSATVSAASEPAKYRTRVDSVCARARSSAGVCRLSERNRQPAVRDRSRMASHSRSSPGRRRSPSKIAAGCSARSVINCSAGGPLSDLLIRVAVWMRPVKPGLRKIRAIRTGWPRRPGWREKCQPPERPSGTAVAVSGLTLYQPAAPGNRIGNEGWSQGTRMANVAVVGSQWGDEGKGKIVDWLSERANVVVRFQGGHNAGHTLVIGNRTYKLSLLPSGVVRPNKLSIIGNGVVVDPWALLKEIDLVRGQGVEITPESLVVAENAHWIWPLHGAPARLREEMRGDHKIGTTGRGIGPAYEDKVGRRAIRVCDLLDKATLGDRVDALLMHHNPLLKGMGAADVK